MEQSIPVVWNGTVYAPGWYDVSNFNLKGSLYALDEQTGTLKWQTLDSLGFTGPLATANGLLYLPADDGNFYAVNASTGAIVWNSLILPNGAGAAIKNGVAYVGGGGTRNVYALDALTGAIIWTYPIPNDLMTSDPAVGRERKHTGVSISL
jgi:outer membrane protein assembly factor BamB